MSYASTKKNRCSFIFSNILCGIYFFIDEQDQFLLDRILPAPKIPLGCPAGIFWALSTVLRLHHLWAKRPQRLQHDPNKLMGVVRSPSFLGTSLEPNRCWCFSPMSFMSFSVESLLLCSAINIFGSGCQPSFHSSCPYFESVVPKIQKQTGQHTPGNKLVNTHPNGRLTPPISVAPSPRHPNRSGGQWTKSNEGRINTKASVNGYELWATKVEYMYKF